MVILNNLLNKKLSTVQYSKTPICRHLLSTDAAILRTICLVPGKECLYIFPDFNPLNTDTPLIWTLSIGFYSPIDVRINEV